MPVLRAKLWLKPDSWGMERKILIHLIFSTSFPFQHFLTLVTRKYLTEYLPSEALLEPQLPRLGLSPISFVNFLTSKNFIITYLDHNEKLQPPLSSRFYLLCHRHTSFNFYICVPRFSFYQTYRKLLNRFFDKSMHIILIIAHHSHVGCDNINGKIFFKKNSLLGVKSYYGKC